jgi:hypothetical protein
MTVLVDNSLASIDIIAILQDSLPYYSQTYPLLTWSNKAIIMF